MRFLLMISFLFALATESTVCAEQFVILSLGKDQKIDVYSLDAAGTLTLKSSVKASGKPGAMCIDREGRHLYVTMKETGTIAVFRIADDAQLSPLGEVVVGGGASYLSLHPSGKFLLSSYYADGKVAIHWVKDDGTLSANPIQMFETDEKAHCVAMDPSGRFVFVSHTRPEAIFQFELEPTTGKLTPNEPARLLRADGSGPRHLWFHPEGTYAYGSDEQGCSVTAYRMDKKTGQLGVVQTVSSLPDDGYTGKTSTSDIEIHPSGRFVYIANRGHNLIASYSIDNETGKLKRLQHTPTEPVTRSFNISPDGRFLVAAGQTSGKLAVFSIDENGLLKRISTIDAGKNPWWVQIVAIKSSTYRRNLPLDCLSVREGRGGLSQ